MAPPNAKGPPIADAKNDPKALLTFPDEAILSRTFINRAHVFLQSLAAFVAAIDPALIAIVALLVLEGAR